MEVVEEIHVFGLNLYTDLLIDNSNHTTYLVDGCHLSEQGRFQLSLLLGAILNRIQ